MKVEEDKYVRLFRQNTIP